MANEGPVLDSDVAALLGAGTGLIVGTLDADGEPFGMRAWAVDVLDARDPPVVRVLLPAGDVRRLGLADEDWPGRLMAVTGADVRTLESVQLKGTVERLEPATAVDGERAARHAASFLDAIAAVDRLPRHVLERMVPVDVVACVVRVGELYDQTPGPRAGARVVR